MNTSQNFAVVMASKGDQELLQILHEADDYAPEAIESAMAEFKKRQLSGYSTARFQAILEKRAAEELCPNCLKAGGFCNSQVCAGCGCDKTVVRFRCNRCARELSAAKSLSGTLSKCPACSTEVVIPEDTSADLIIASVKTTEEYCQDLHRLRSFFLRAGMPAEDWEATLADLIALSPDQLRDCLHKKQVPVSAALPLSLQTLRSARNAGGRSQGKLAAPERKRRFEVTGFVGNVTVLPLLRHVLVSLAPR